MLTEAAPHVFEQAFPIEQLEALDDLRELVALFEPLPAQWYRNLRADNATEVAIRRVAIRATLPRVVSKRLLRSGLSRSRGVRA